MSPARHPACTRCGSASERLRRTGSGLVREVRSIVSRVLVPSAPPGSCRVLGGLAEGSGPPAISAPSRRARRLLLPSVRPRTTRRIGSPSTCPRRKAPHLTRRPASSWTGSPPSRCAHCLRLLPAFRPRTTRRTGGPLEEASPELAAPPAAQPGAFADWEPACEFEEQGIWAALILPPPAEAARSRTVQRGHFPRRNPRHAGPRFLHAGGGAEICRQFNRGRCGGQVCAHNKAHVCSQCGVAGHAATGCTTPESAWPAKE